MKTKIEPSFFVAQEINKYTLGSPPGGVIWGKRIKFKSTPEWQHDLYESTYDKGTKFTYIGIEAWRFHFKYIFDCKIICPTGDSSNYFSINTHVNRVEVDSVTLKIVKEKQVVHDLYVEMHKGDSLHLTLASRELINLIELGEYPYLNEVTAESHY